VPAPELPPPSPPRGGAGRAPPTLPRPSAPRNPPRGHWQSQMPARLFSHPQTPTALTSPRGAACGPLFRGAGCNLPTYRRLVPPEPPRAHRQSSEAVGRAPPRPPPIPTTADLGTADPAPSNRTKSRRELSFLRGLAGQFLSQRPFGGLWRHTPPPALPVFPKVEQGQKGMAEEQPRPSKDHHPAHFLPLLGPVTMNRTGSASGFVLTEGAKGKPAQSIPGELLTSRTEDLAPVKGSAIQANHGQNRFPFPLPPASQLPHGQNLAPRARQHLAPPQISWLSGSLGGVGSPSRESSEGFSDLGRKERYNPKVF
jgi:hypothetical protein